MSANYEQALYRAVFQVLRPLVRVLLRNGVPFSAFAEITRRAYVQVAEQDFSVEGKKQTNSRISTITGLSRKEVQRLKTLTDEDVSNTESLKRYNRAARVVTGWVRDDRYSPGGTPTLLPIESNTEPSFASLVKDYSGDVPPRAILDELLQVGVVEYQNEQVKLLARAYIPKTDPIEKLTIMGTDVAGLIASIDHNIEKGETDPFFQRKVYYDNLPEEAIPVLRAFIGKHAQELLEKMDHSFSAHDRDVNPTVKGTGKKAAGIGVYYFEGDDSEEK